MVARASLYSSAILLHCLRNSGNNIACISIKWLFLTDICVFSIMLATEPDHLPPATISLAKTYEARRKTNSKFLHTNTCPLCSDKMTKFMHEHAQSKDRNGSQ